MYNIIIVNFRQRCICNIFHGHQYVTVKITYVLQNMYLLFRTDRNRYITSTMHLKGNNSNNSIVFISSGSHGWVPVWCFALPPEMWGRSAQGWPRGPPGIHLLQATGCVWILFQEIPRGCLWKGNKILYMYLKKILIFTINNLFS